MFKRYPVEDKIAEIHNAKPINERKWLCAHGDAERINEIEHVKLAVQKHHSALMRELNERQRRVVQNAEERLREAGLEKEKEI
jgi:hypothetical protein